MRKRLTLLEQALNIEHHIRVNRAMLQTQLVPPGSTPNIASVSTPPVSAPALSSHPSGHQSSAITGHTPTISPPSSAVPIHPMYQQKLFQHQLAQKSQLQQQQILQLQQFQQQQHFQELQQQQQVQLQQLRLKQQYHQLQQQYIEQQQLRESQKSQPQLVKTQPPIHPTAIVQPIVHQQSIQPTQSTNHTQPTQYTLNTQPAQPTQPTQSTQHTLPVHNTQPSSPQSAQPIQPIQPVQSQATHTSPKPTGITITLKSPPTTTATTQSNTAPPTPNVQPSPTLPSSTAQDPRISFITKFKELYSAVHNLKEQTLTMLPSDPISDSLRKGTHKGGICRNLTSHVLTLTISDLYAIAALASETQVRLRDVP